MGTSVIGAYYKDFIQNILRLKICKLYSGMLKSGVLILHNYAYPHISAPIMKFLKNTAGNNSATEFIVLI